LRSSGGRRRVHGRARTGIRAAALRRSAQRAGWSSSGCADRRLRSMTVPSRTHLVLIPSYNPGNKVYPTVRAAREQWEPVWVVVDGSNDGTAAGLLEMSRNDPGLRVLVRERNGGKGAAVLEGLLAARAHGF